jgi:sugar phosphate isomerase/epimerase
MVSRCAEHGITYGHENCMNYGGQSHEHSLKLVEAMNSEFFTLIFDTGNPPITDLRMGEPPYKKQSSWEFYQGIKEHVSYVHIKDATFIEENGNIFPDAKFFFPGEGSGDIPRIVKDLLNSGYDGGFSMEPHMAMVFHEDTDASDKAKIMKDNYIEYGRRFMKLVEDIKTS